MAQPTTKRCAGLALWGVATAALVFGDEVACWASDLVPGSTPGGWCEARTPAGDRLSALLVPASAGDMADPVFWAQLVFNVMWFIPFGALVAHRCRSWRVAFAVGLGAGLFIETGQLLFTAGRYPSAFDALLNAAGAALGWTAMARRSATGRGTELIDAAH